MSDGYLCHGGEHCTHGSDSTHWVDAAPSRIWVLGADDPEMQAIERLLRQAGEKIAYAIGVDGKRVHPGNAYNYDGSVLACTDAELPGRVIFQVECDYDRSRQGPSGRLIQIDHHRPGDPGYGMPPEEFLRGSSIGQVFKRLRGMPLYYSRPTGVWYTNDQYADPASRVLVDQDHVMVAAADHCLEAAYRGRCPGVYPDALMRWRAESRAAFQKRPVEDVLADIDSARRILRAGMPEEGFREGCFRDLRGENIPELPEAACRDGIPFLSTVRDRDGREKVVLQAAPADLVRRFLAGELVPGLCDYYGSPERGLAGGYTSPRQ